jgi:hypothetical protein
MKKRMIIISVFIGVVSADAQTKSDSLKTDPDFKKNEISINTAPVLRQLLNSSGSSATRFSVSYKRNLNERSALRFSLVADRINDDFYPKHGADREIILLNSDSVIIRQETISPGYISPHFNIGYERLFGKGKLKWFYGADLALGYSESHSLKQNITLNRDSIQGTYGWVENNYQPEIVSKTTVKSVMVGVTPFFGVKYPLSKRFSLSAQVGVDVVFKSQDAEEKGSGINKRSHFSSFDFNQDTGFLNDISLIYKF